MIVIKIGLAWETVLIDEVQKQLLENLHVKTSQLIDLNTTNNQQLKKDRNEKKRKKRKKKEKKTGSER